MRLMSVRNTYAGLSAAAKTHALMTRPGRLRMLCCG